jgi:hypothetical protein
MGRPRARDWSDEDLHQAAQRVAGGDQSVRQAAAAAGVSIGTLRNYLAAHPELRTVPAAAVAREVLVKLCRGVDLALLTPTGTDTDAVQRAYDDLVDRIENGTFP